MHFRLEAVWIELRQVGGMRGKGGGGEVSSGAICYRFHLNSSTEKKICKKLIHAHLSNLSI